MWVKTKNGELLNLSKLNKIKIDENVIVAFDSNNTFNRKVLYQGSNCKDVFEKIVKLLITNNKFIDVEEIQN
jgi:hypothetical protein